MELAEWFVPAEIVRQRLSLAHFISVDHLTVGQVLPWQQTLVYHIADRLSFHILCCSVPSWELQSVSDSVQCVIPQNWSHSVTQSILHTRPLEADSTCISLLCPTKPVAGNYHTDNNNCFFLLRPTNLYPGRHCTDNNCVILYHPHTFSGRLWSTIILQCWSCACLASCRLVHSWRAISCTFSSPLPTHTHASCAIVHH